MISLKNKNYIFIIFFIITSCLFFWFLNTFKIIDQSFKEDSGWQKLSGLKKVKKCINLLLGEKLIYSFISSSNVSFNIDSKEKELFVNFLKSENKKYGKGVFIPPKDGIFCLSWKNPELNEISLNYNTQIILDQEKDRIPVNFIVTSDNKSLQIVKGSGDVIYKITIGSPIVNFAINNNSTILTVSVSDPKTNLRIYDLNNMKILRKLQMKITPRFIVFSNDDRFISVGDEHSFEIKRVDLKSGIIKTLKLPLFPIALFVDENPNELLVRSKEEVIKIKIDTMELIERNARIKFVFGDETILADPTEICTVHGIPHPLFTPRQVAMSSEGLRGYFFNYD